MLEIRALLMACRGSFPCSRHKAPPGVDRHTSKWREELRPPWFRRNPGKAVLAGTGRGRATAPLRQGDYTVMWWQTVLSSAYRGVQTCWVYSAPLIAG